MNEQQNIARKGASAFRLAALALSLGAATCAWAKTYTTVLTENFENADTWSQNLKNGMPKNAYFGVSSYSPSASLSGNTSQGERTLSDGVTKSNFAYISKDGGATENLTYVIPDETLSSASDYTIEFDFGMSLPITKDSDAARRAGFTVNDANDKPLFTFGSIYGSSNGDKDTGYIYNGDDSNSPIASGLTILGRGKDIKTSENAYSWYHIKIAVTDSKMFLTVTGAGGTVACNNVLVTDSLSAKVKYLGVRFVHYSYFCNIGLDDIVIKAGTPESFEWTGTSNTSWTTPGNWTVGGEATDHYPEAGDTATVALQYQTIAVDPSAALSKLNLDPTTKLSFDVSSLAINTSLTLFQYTSGGETTLSSDYITLTGTTALPEYDFSSEGSVGITLWSDGYYVWSGNGSDKNWTTVGNWAYGEGTASTKSPDSNSTIVFPSTFSEGVEVSMNSRLGKSSMTFIVDCDTKLASTVMGTDTGGGESSYNFALSSVSGDGCLTVSNMHFQAGTIDIKTDIKVEDKATFYIRAGSNSITFSKSISGDGTLNLRGDTNSKKNFYLKGSLADFTGKLVLQDTSNTTFNLQGNDDTFDLADATVELGGSSTTLKLGTGTYTENTLKIGRLEESGTINNNSGNALALEVGSNGTAAKSGVKLSGTSGWSVNKVGSNTQTFGSAFTMPSDSTVTVAAGKLAFDMDITSVASVSLTAVGASIDVLNTVTLSDETKITQTLGSSYYLKKTIGETYTTYEAALVVATVDGENYTTLADAAAAASAGDTISVVGDITSGNLHFSGLYAGKTLEFGKKLTPTDYVWVGTDGAEYDSASLTWKSSDGSTSYGINQGNDAGNIRIADRASQTSRLVIDSGYYHAGNDILISGNTGSKAYVTMNGGRLESRYWTRISEGKNSTSEVTINNGQLFVGSDGTTEDGTSRMRIGIGAGSTTTFTQNNGTTKAWEIYVGEGSSSETTLTLTSGTIYAHGEIWLGAGASSVNRTYVKGGTLSNDSWFCVGRAAGTDTYLEVDGGTVSSTGNITVGTCGDSTSQAEMVVKSGTVTTSQNLYVGEWDNATVTIEDGSVTANYNVVLGDNAAFGNGETATLNLNGGTLTTWKIAKGSNGTGTTVVNFNGGTLKALGESNVLIGSDLSSVKVAGANGMIIDSDYAVSIPASVTKGDGEFTPALTKKGTGALWVAALPSGTVVSVEGGSVTVPATSGCIAAAGTVRTVSGDNYVFEKGPDIATDATKNVSAANQEAADAIAATYNVTLTSAQAAAGVESSYYKVVATETSTAGTYALKVEFADKVVPAVSEETVDGDTVTFAVSNFKKGLYYGVAAGNDPDLAVTGATLTQCTDASTGVPLTANLPGADESVKYYKIIVSDTNAAQ